VATSGGEVDDATRAADGVGEVDAEAGVATGREREKATAQAPWTTGVASSCSTTRSMVRAR
jgi:hypothetical protein